MNTAAPQSQYASFFNKFLEEYKGVDALRGDTFNKTFYQNVSARQPFTQLTRFRVKY
jgi:hypothetical protein